MSVFAKWNESVEIAITKQRNVRLKEKRDLNQKLILEDPASTMKVKSLTTGLSGRGRAFERKNVLVRDLFWAPL